MMDNYDRTMELVNVAYDSNGKAAEQFGKYSDTLEYKLNKLTNTWEQMRLKFLNSEFLKDAVDMLNNLLTKVQNFDGLDFTKIGAVWLIFGKRAIEQFLKGVQSASSGIYTMVQKRLTNVFNKINSSKAVSSIKTTLHIESNADKEMKSIRTTLLDLQKNMNLQLKVDDTDAQVDLEKVKQKINELRGLAANYAEGTRAQAYLTNKANKLEQDYNDYNTNSGKLGNIANKQAQIQEQKAQLKGQAIGQAFSVGITTAVTAYMTNDNPGEIFKTTMITTLTSAIPLVVGVFTTMGVSASAAFTATGVGAIVVGIGLAIAGLATGLKAWSKYTEEQAQKQAAANSEYYSAVKTLEMLEEKQEELNETLDEANQKYDEAKTSLDNFNQARKDFEEYSEKDFLGVEEAEEFLTKQQEIADMFPELIEYYDEEGNAILTKIGGAWDEVLKKKQEYYKEAAVEQAQAETEANLGNALIADTKVKRDQAFVEEMNSDFMNELFKVENANRTFVEDNNRFNKLTGKIETSSGKSDYGKYSDVTWVGTLDHLSSADKEKYGTLFKDAIERSGMDLGIELSGNGSDIISTITDWLTQGDEEDEQAHLETLKEALSKSKDINLSTLEKEAIAAKEALDESMEGLVVAQIDTLEQYNNASENVQGLMSKYLVNTLDKNGIDYEGLKKSFYEAASSVDYIDEKWFDESGEVISTYQEEAAKALQLYVKDYGDKLGIDSSALETKLGKAFDEQTTAILNKLYDSVINEGWSIVEQIKYIQNADIDQDIKDAFYEEKAALISAYNKQLEYIAGIMGETSNIVTDQETGLASSDKGFTGWYSTLSDETKNAIESGVKTATEHLSGEDATAVGKAYGENIQKAIQSGFLSEEVYQNFMNSDIFSDNFSILDLEKTKEKFVEDVEEMGYSTEEAMANWDALYNYAQDYGMIEFGITTEDTLNEYVDEMENNLNNIVKSYEDASNAITTQLENGGLNLSEYLELSETLSEVGLNVQDYITGMQNGLYQLNTDALTQAYHDAVDAESITVDQLKSQLEERLHNLEAIKAQGNSEGQYIVAVDESTNALWDQYEAAYALYKVTKAKVEAEGGTAPELEYVTERKITSRTYTYDAAAIDAEIDAINTLLADDKKLQAYTDAINANSAAHAQIAQKEADSIDKATKATKGGSSAAKDAADAADKLREAQEKLNEALYGTENYKNAADHLANYTERLEELTEKANKAKESLEDLGETDSAKDLLSDYAENVKLENITRTAENQVLQQSTNDLLNILNDKYSEYFQKVGDTWMWNASIVDAQMNDNEKDFLIESIENLNEYQDKIDENLDAIEEREKEFKEMRKTALDSRIALEEEVVNILEEKYQKEIDATQEKYDALKEADDDYLDALEDAINKQRELRDRANEYEDLAQKERKLALKQRDTSGANKKDTLQLQQEVEESRQNMLDNEVDRLLESMKEMYELQQESREAELEYMNAMVENGQLLQEANEIIASFSTREDMLAWFFENNQELADMSVAATEKYKMELEDMYDAAELYYAMSETNLEELTSFTEEEVSDTVATIGETLTLEAERSYNEMKETVEKEVEDAKQAVIDAQKAVEDAAAGSASAVGGAAGAMTNAAGTTATTAQQTIKTVEDVCTNTINAVAAAAYNAKVASGNVTKMKNEVYKGGASVGSYVAGVKARMAITETLNTATNNETIYHSTNNNNTYEDQGDIKYKIVIGNDAYYFKSRNDFMKYKKSAPIGSTYAGSIRNGKREWDQFKTGGLVDYTGPAWVDGTPSKPEAFLNSDDTKRIGEAAKLLSNLPILNSTSSASTPLSTNIGDTSIEIHINVDSISSDYDVDRLAERIKSDIVDASKPVGTPVILKR